MENRLALNKPVEYGVEHRAATRVSRYRPTKRTAPTSASIRCNFFIKLFLSFAFLCIFLHSFLCNTKLSKPWAALHIGRISNTGNWKGVSNYSYSIGRFLEVYTLSLEKNIFLLNSLAQNLNLATMFFRLPIISNAHRKDSACVFWLFARHAHEF